MTAVLVTRIQLEYDLNRSQGAPNKASLDCSFRYRADKANERIKEVVSMFAIKTPVLALSAAITLHVVMSSGALAQKKYDPGATDAEIRIGSIKPYSGPASAFGIVGKTQAAYFNKINAEGGINGRKIDFISYDDGYSPPKAIEQVRKLVESDEVLLVFNPLGTASNSAIRKYVNAKKVPQLFVGSGATKWNDPANFPWTMGWQPSYELEARVYAKYILKERPEGKIGILYQNDDYGKDFVQGLKEGLGARAASMIVGEEAYEPGYPTIESLVVSLKSKGADIFISVTTPKFAAQSIKKIAELGWKPLFILNNIGSSVGSVMHPAGLENGRGIISASFAKDPTDPQWKDDVGIKHFDAFLQKYFPEGDRTNSSVMYGCGLAQTLVHVLSECGDNLTRANVMKQAAGIRDLELEGLLPGVKINTSATDFAPIHQLQLMQFTGDRWALFGDVVNGDDIE
jgi:branched-chain amino acid transport system substrate-binding protein